MPDFWEPTFWESGFWESGFWEEGAAAVAAPYVHVVRGMRTPLIELWSDKEAASGSVIARVPEWGRGSYVERSLRGDGSLVLRAPAEPEAAEAFAYWIREANTGRVLRYNDPVLGTDAGEFFTPTSIEEYRIRRRLRVDGANSATVGIEALPIITDLTRVGPIYETVGGVPNYELGEQTLTWAEAWDDLILPFLTDVGETWWERVSTSGTAVTVSVSRMTPLALLRAIADAQDSPLQVVAQHNGATSIQVYVTAQGFQSGLLSPTRKLNRRRDGEKVLSITEDETAERSANVAVPQRSALAGSTSTMGLMGLVFRVSGVAGSDVTLVDPENAAGLSWEDDALGGGSGYPNHYLVKPDGTLTEITDHVDDTVTVADATGISTNDYVEIRRNASGDSVLEAVNPSDLALRSRKVAVVTDENPFGRNYIINPLHRDWPNTDYPEAYACRLDATYTAGASTIDLKELPLSTTIKDRSRVVVMVSGDSWATTVDGDTATDGSGDVTLPLDGALRNTGNLAANCRAFVFQEPDEDLADDWSPFQGTTIDPSGAFTPIYAKRDMTQAVTSVAGAVDATVALAPPNGTGSLTQIALKGLSDITVLQPGDLIVHDSGGEGLPVMARAAVSGGAATVPVWPRDSKTWTEDDAVTVVRPNFAGYHYGGDAIVCWRDRTGVSGSTGNHGFISTPLPVPFIDGWVLRATVRWGVYNNDESDETVTPAAGVQGLTVAIHNDGAGLGTEHAMQEATETTYPGRALTIHEVTVDYEPSATENLRVRVEPIHQAGTNVLFDAGLTMCLLEVSLSYGPVAHTQVGVEYSHTNVLYRRLHERLASLKSPRAIEVEWRDIAYSVEDVPADKVAENKTVVGEPWFFYSQALGLDARPGVSVDDVFRLVRYRKDLHDLTRATGVFDHDIFRLSHEAD